MTDTDADVVGWMHVVHTNGAHTYWAFGCEEEFAKAFALMRDKASVVRSMAYTGPSNGILADSGGMNDAAELENCLRERGELTCD